jgi:HPt (histidine-containing phosphotransfer) domain-containing protein
MDDDPLDAATLQQLRELGDDAFIAELAEIYLADFEPAFAKLLAANQDADWTTAITSSHFLKGSSMSIGLLTLGQVLAQVESHFRADGGRLDDAVLCELHSRADQAQARLQVLLAESEESGISGR